jgi:hypothetical protein
MSGMKSKIKIKVHQKIKSKKGENKKDRGKH